MRIRLNQGGWFVVGERELLALIRESVGRAA